MNICFVLCPAIKRKLQAYANLIADCCNNANHRLREFHQGVPSGGIRKLSFVLLRTCCTFVAIKETHSSFEQWLFDMHLQGLWNLCLSALSGVQLWAGTFGTCAGSRLRIAMSTAIWTSRIDAGMLELRLWMSGSDSCQLLNPLDFNVRYHSQLSSYIILASSVFSVAIGGSQGIRTWTFLKIIAMEVFFGFRGDSPLSLLLVVIEVANGAFQTRKRLVHTLVQNQDGFSFSLAGMEVTGSIHDCPVSVPECRGMANC